MPIAPNNYKGLATIQRLKQIKMGKELVKIERVEKELGTNLEKEILQIETFGMNYTKEQYMIVYVHAQTPNKKNQKHIYSYDETFDVYRNIDCGECICFLNVV